MTVVYYANQISYITMLFHGKRHKKFVNIAWTVIAVLVILSMILLYTPIFMQ